MQTTRLMELAPITETYELEIRVSIQLPYAPHSVSSIYRLDERSICVLKEVKRLRDKLSLESNPWLIIDYGTAIKKQERLVATISNQITMSLIRELEK